VLGPGSGQALAAISRLEQPMSLMTEQRHQKFPIGREVVHDQNGRDLSLRLIRARIGSRDRRAAGC
jgi:hypothetical protein